jgi:hypothetical protein
MPTGKLPPWCYPRRQPPHKSTLSRREKDSTTIGEGAGGINSEEDVA